MRFTYLKGPIYYIVSKKSIYYVSLLTKNLI